MSEYNTYYYEQDKYRTGKGRLKMRKLHLDQSCLYAFFFSVSYLWIMDVATEWFEINPLIGYFPIGLLILASVGLCLNLGKWLFNYYFVFTQSPKAIAECKEKSPA